MCSGLPSSLVRAQPGSDEFLEVLKRIDQAIEFFLQVQHTLVLPPLLPAGD